MKYLCRSVECLKGTVRSYELSVPAVLFVQTDHPIFPSLHGLLLKQISVVMNVFEHRHLPSIKNKDELTVQLHNM